MADEDTKKDDAAEEVAAPQEEAKSEAPAEEAAAPVADDSSDDAGEEFEVPEKFKAFIEQIEQMSVLELHELVKVFEKKFGVSAQAVAVAAPGAGDGGAEEQDAFTVTLKDPGAAKIQVIKAVKEILGLGLKEAKDLVDGTPAELKKDIKKEEAEEIKTKLEEAGGVVEVS